LSALVVTGCGESNRALPSNTAGSAGSSTDAGGAGRTGGAGGASSTGSGAGTLGSAASTPGGSGGVSGASAAQGGVGGLILPPITSGGVMSCVLPTTATPIFAEQAVAMTGIAKRELYSWTTAEQVAEIRAKSTLLTREEREGQGPGYAIDFLKQRAADYYQGEEAALAQVLLGSAFAKARYAWSNPWATRMGFPGENYGNQLLRLLLRQEALIVRLVEGGLSVIDMNNEEVALADALATPERIAGMFFLKDGVAGGPSCGTFSSGGEGYREFIIGNESMIEEWSLGTAQIRDRVAADVALLERFLERIRACPALASTRDWGLNVGCGWSRALSATLDEERAYDAALALASPYYLPAPAELAKVIDTLRGDPFELNPLVVRPGD
jgi:hypothetical protein